jgi:hypothetical protein
MNKKLNNQNDNTNDEGQAEPESDLSSCGPGCECKTEKGISNRTKVIISLVIILAAGAVLTRTIVRKANTIPNDNNTAFESVQTQDPPQDKGTVEPEKAESNVAEPANTKRSFWKEPLSSMSALNTVAADNDAVIVLVSERGMQKASPEVNVIDAAAKTITSRGINIAAFSLKKDAPEFSDLSKQLSGSGVLVMVKGRGMSAVSSGEITENKLLQAYVSASQPRSGCGPSCGPSDCK